MSTFTFLHAADLHLDTPFEGLRTEGSALWERLRDASLQAFDRLVDLALEREVAFVVLAGDIYDGAERGLRAQLRFRKGLERLAAAGIPTLIVHGNHDPLDEGWSAIQQWPRGVHVFGSDEVEAVAIEREGHRLATIYGISFARRAETTNLARRFQRGPDQGLHVGLLHCNAEGQVGHDPYAPCSLADLEEAQLDYWALGHVHSRQILLKGRSWAAYPGNLQGRSFKKSEQGPKGALLVHVVQDAIRELEFVPLAPIVFGSVEVDITGLEGLEELEDRLLEQADEIEGEGRMLVARLVGEGPLHEPLSQRVDELLEALRDARSWGQRWIHWDRLIVGTSPPIDRVGLREQGDLLGTFLRRLDRLVGDAGERATLLRELDEALRSRTLAPYIPPISNEEAEALLRAVERRAIARLGEQP